MTVEIHEVLCPVGEPGAEPAPSAARLQGLQGRTIGLLSNGQFRADKVLATVGELIRQRFPDARVVPWTEFPQIEAMGDVEQRVAQLDAALRRIRPDAVVSSTGA